MHRGAGAGGSAPRDYGPEEVYFEGPPHRGDLVANIALGATLLWLPLTFAAIGRGAFDKCVTVHYCITSCGQKLVK